MAFISSPATNLSALYPSFPQTNRQSHGKQSSFPTKRQNFPTAHANSWENIPSENKENLHDSVFLGEDKSLPQILYYNDHHTHLISCFPGVCKSTHCLLLLPHLSPLSSLIIPLATGASGWGYRMQKRTYLQLPSLIICLSLPLPSLYPFSISYQCLEELFSWGRGGTTLLILLQSFSFFLSAFSYCSSLPVNQ